MDSIFRTLTAAAQASQFALDQQGRQYGLQFAVVTDNNDPQGLRRLKVATESKGGITQSDWCFPMKILPGYDPPLPLVGTSVIVAAIDGNPHDMVWLGPVYNATNPPYDKDSVVDDQWHEIPGNQVHVVGSNKAHTVGSDEKRRTEGDLTISVGKNLTLKNDAGCVITLSETGYIILQDAYGNKLVLGGASSGHGDPSDFIWNTVSGDCQWNLNGHALHIINPSDVSIAGKSAIVLGSVDTRGDANNDRGY